jgi:hypothetical protein
MFCVRWHAELFQIVLSQLLRRKAPRDGNQDSQKSQADLDRLECSARNSKMNNHAPLTVHPAAEAYRLMTDEELAALAADIAENGQHDPVILGRVKDSTEQHQIIDGRNRAKACGIAGVVPAFETREFESDDAIRAFVKSRSERRDLSKSQRAMGHALLFPSPTLGGPRKNGAPLVTKGEGFTYERLSRARTVLANSRDVALAIRDGSESLDDAYAKVIAERKVMESTEATLARLQAEAPDLADLVAEERMKLDEAMATLERRRAQEREQREATLRVMANAVDAIAAFDSKTFCDAVEVIIADPVGRTEFTKRLGGGVDPEKLKRGCENFIEYIGGLS